jgi:SSS family solute:Na+ symporter
MLRLGTLASVVVGLLSMLLAWKMRDIIDILQLGFTINAAGLFLPTVAALYGNRVTASAAFWSIGASLVTVIGWRAAADAGAGGIFAVDPLWPGLAVSAVLLFALTALHPRRAAGTAA